MALGSEWHKSVRSWVICPFVAGLENLAHWFTQSMSSSTCYLLLILTVEKVSCLSKTQERIHLGKWVFRHLHLNQTIRTDDESEYPMMQTNSIYHSCLYDAFLYPNVPHHEVLNQRADSYSSTTFGKSYHNIRFLWKDEPTYKDKHMSEQASVCTRRDQSCLIYIHHQLRNRSHVQKLTISKGMRSFIEPQFCTSRDSSCPFLPLLDDYYII